MSFGVAASATTLTSIFRFNPVASHNRFNRSSVEGGNINDLPTPERERLAAMRRQTSITSETTPRRSDTVLTGTELARRTRATYRQIDYWHRQDLIAAAPSRHRGSGHRRRFSESVVPVVDALATVSRVTQPTRAHLLLEAVSIAARAGETSVTVDGVLIDWSAA
jgi:hypothetical protein